MGDEPKTIYAGDTLSWVRAGDLYPASAGWVLSYFFNTGSGTTPTKVDAVPQVDDYLVTVPSATTTTFPAGYCHWLAVVVGNGETHTLEEGTFEVLPAPGATVDRRSHAEKCLAAITAVLEGAMGDPIIEYEIDGVKAKKLPHDQLMQLRAHYKSLVRRQKGGAPFRRFPVVFWP